MVPKSLFGVGRITTKLGLNQFQGGSQATFPSGNFGSPLQFSSGFGGSGVYGGAPQYGGTSESETSDGYIGMPGRNRSGGSRTRDNCEENDANLPED